MSLREICRRTDWPNGCASADVGYRTFSMGLAARDWGPEDPRQDVRSATEAAGAANVVDGTPPGQRGQRSNGWTTHRPNRVRKNRLRRCDPVARRTSRARCPAHLEWSPHPAVALRVRADLPTSGEGLGLSVGVRHREPPSGREDTDENDRVFAWARQADRGRDVRVACLACGEAASGHVDNAVRGQAAHRGLAGADRVDATDGGNHETVHGDVDHALLADGARA